MNTTPRAPWLLFALLAVVMTACEFTPPQKEPVSYVDPKEPTPQDIDREEGYALLYDLLKQESGVSDIFTVKGASDPVKQIINDIAAASKQGTAAIEDIARSEAFMSLEDTGLPKVEEQTRKKIAFATAGSLLLSSGSDFELKLLLTQSEATKYAHFLALTVAASEEDPKHKQTLDKIAEQFKTLNQRVVAMLSIKTNEQPSK